MLSSWPFLRSFYPGEKTRGWFVSAGRKAKGGCGRKGGGKERKEEGRGREKVEKDLYSGVGCSVLRERWLAKWRDLFLLYLVPWHRSSLYTLRRTPLSISEKQDTRYREEGERERERVSVELFDRRLGDYSTRYMFFLLGPIFHRSPGIFGAHYVAIFHSKIRKKQHYCSSDSFFRLRKENFGWLWGPSERADINIAVSR